MADAQINGARIWYEVHGEGEDYLLQIGGAGFAHENFGFVTDKMTPHFIPSSSILRGYGLSASEQEYSMEVWADDIKGLFDAIGVERAHVHGTSMGGMVALAFAGRYPELVDGLVLDCASAKSDFMARAHWEVWKQLAQAYGMGGEPLALEIATKCLSRRFLDTRPGPRRSRSSRACSSATASCRSSPAPATPWRRWTCGRMPPRSRRRRSS